MRATMLRMVMLMALLVGMAPWALAVPAAPAGDVYTLDSCPISGKKLSEVTDPVVKQYDGREVRFCSADCVGKFEADQAGYLKKIDAEVVAQQKDKYPLDTCVISGEKLGGMGEAVEYVYNNRLVRFCCKGCVAKFEKDPAASLAKLDQAVIDKQVATYPLKTCLVSGEALGGMGDTIDYVAGNQLVRFCCKGCVKKFEANPAAYLGKLSAGAEAGSDAKPQAEDSGSH